jgi:hypothetical protein
VNPLDAQSPLDLLLMRETDILERLSAPGIELRQVLVVLPECFVIGVVFYGKFQIKQAERIG